ncbi:hypothetical protein QAD02_009619 [Eretmocerus hayati]|uniref:Uncharacterized protein n=1 Tax=Eretmocerus hayati TaxID=131215 RepID=A0ACC2NA68_9HYME|nr:hypothetical protein QAD02_009619 [Eretmocerus hayati]
MHDPSNDQCDNVSIRSDESSMSNSSALREKLESLMRSEMKHSQVLHDLQSKNNLLRLDLENLNNSCERFAKQKSKKNEILEERYKQLTECQNRNKNHLREKLSSTIKKLDDINAKFCQAFDDYKPQILKDTIEALENQRHQEAQRIKISAEQLNVLESKDAEILMNPRPIPTSNLEIVTKELADASMKRPEIELEARRQKIKDNIRKLQEKRQKLTSNLRKSR